MSSKSTSERVVIVGGGAFGLSTALELSARGFSDIVVLDRHIPPVCYPCSPPWFPIDIDSWSPGSRWLKRGYIQDNPL